MKPLLSLAMVAGIPVAALSISAMERVAAFGSRIPNSVASQLRGGTSTCTKMWSTGCTTIVGSTSCLAKTIWKENAPPSGTTTISSKVNTASSVYCGTAGVCNAWYAKGTTCSGSGGGGD